MDLQVLQLGLSVAMLTLLLVRGMFERSAYDERSFARVQLRTVYYGLIATSVALVVVSSLQLRASGSKPVEHDSQITMGYPVPHSETTFSALVGQEAEMQGYGLYSYLLFGSQPSDDEARERCVAALISISSLPSTRKMRRSFSREALNITYVPLTKSVDITSHPTDRKTALIMLNAYNYPRGRSLIDKIDPTLRSGPYIISVLKPLTLTAGVPDKFLFQDLSSVTPRVVSSWVTIFQSEVAKEEFWEPENGRRFASELRSVIDVVAHQIMPNMPPKIAAWIGWQDVQGAKEP
jgi:hypothetical protein